MMTTPHNRVEEYDRVQQQIKLLESDPVRNESLLNELRQRSETLRLVANDHLNETVDPLEKAMVSLSGVADRPMGPITSHNSASDDGDPNNPTNPNGPASDPLIGPNTDPPPVLDPNPPTIPEVYPPDTNPPVDPVGDPNSADRPF